MFVVKLNNPRFEYDVHSLVKAFYPEETVKVLTPETLEEKKAELEKEVRIEIELTSKGAQVSFGNDEKQTHAWVYDGSTEDTKVYKDSFKKFLYQVLSQHTGKKLPWGNLTGIRPTKIAMGMLEEGKSEEEIKTYLQEDHLVSDEKANLSIDIAKYEREILSEVHFQDGYSLYVGIPFCPTTCLYCSFTSYPIAAHRDRVEAYIDCLIKEMKFVAQKYAHKILDSVYIGGGTPTTLTAEQLDRLISALKETFDFGTVQEFTVEAGRADSITREKLEVLYKHQVDRISINPQTMKQDTLKIIGRAATVEQTKEAYKLAREVGFDNINMDIILGLPGETEADVAMTIEEIEKLNPDSLTVHSLAIKRASRLSQWILENGISTLNNTDATMEIAAQGAKNLGMEPYYLYRQKNMSGNFENVGYAKPGKAGLYNILIMEEKQTIVALGAGASTKAVYPDGRIERCENVKDVNNYIARIDEMIERKRSFFKDFDF
ncbi:MAG: coproporphyrinogen dehydrogenase HemZ [Lachnospiraceae bacterium]|nr:coproporphyrinogen dehydrogenase HemZ [Lachnospiraceae bacterium]